MEVYDSLVIVDKWFIEIIEIQSYMWYLEMKRT